MQEKNRVPWFWFAVLFSAGFFIACGTRFAGQLEANLLNLGVLGHFIGVTPPPEGRYQYLAHFYSLVPVAAVIPSVLCPGALLSEATFKFPAAKGTPAARLANGATSPSATQTGVWLWLTFGLGMAVWLLPTAYAWLKALV